MIVNLKTSGLFSFTLLISAISFILQVILFSHKYLSNCHMLLCLYYIRSKTVECSIRCVCSETAINFLFCVFLGNVGEFQGWHEFYFVMKISKA